MKRGKKSKRILSLFMAFVLTASCFSGVGILGLQEIIIRAEGKTDFNVCDVQIDHSMFINKQEQLQRNAINTTYAKNRNKKVACGSYVTAVIKEDGSLWMAGRNESGQFGDGTTEDSLVFKKIEGVSNVKDVCVSSFYTAIIKEDGSLWMAGQGLYGVFGNGDPWQRTSFVEIKSVGKVKKVSCGYNHTAIIKEDGSLWVTGDNQYGQLGDGSNRESFYFKEIPSVGKVKDVSCGLVLTGVVSEDGSLWMAGTNMDGEFGDGKNYSTSNVFKEITNIGKVKNVYCGDNYSTIVIKEDGSIVVWHIK